MNIFELIPSPSPEHNPLPAVMTVKNHGTDVFEITSQIGSVEVEVTPSRSWAEITWLQVPEEQRGGGRQNGAKLLAAAGKACTERDVSFLRGSITLPAALATRAKVFGGTNLLFYDHAPESVTAEPNSMAYESALLQLTLNYSRRDALVSAGKTEEADRNDTYVHVGVDLSHPSTYGSLQHTITKHNILMENDLLIAPVAPGTS